MFVFILISKKNKNNFRFQHPNNK